MNRKITLFLSLLVLSGALLACSGLQNRSKSQDQKYYELVFVWVKNPQAFGEYGRKVMPIVQKYGGGMQRMILPEVVYGKGLRKPHFINLVYYKNREAYMAFNRDPAFLKIKHLRTKGIDMIAIGAQHLESGMGNSDPAKRRYMIELAYFKSSNGASYRNYERTSRPVMSKYGYKLERKLFPLAVHGNIEKPDLLKVSYFNDTKGLKRFEKDPRHKEIETVLYPGAVRKSIWIMGKVHPMTLPKKK